MGQEFSRRARPHQGALDPPSFDPLYGFSEGRQERVMVATKEEMVSAKIPLKHRDYCAHLLINFKACKRDVWPMAYKCHHELHAHEECEYNDYVLRAKEFEREKRLKAREARKAAREAAHS